MRENGLIAELHAPKCWVRAIHLVGPDGTQYWIEPQDRPITNAIDNDRLLRDALGPHVVIKRDNEWFESTLVTVGSLGIVYSVVFEVRPAYKLRETRTAVKWSALRARLGDKTVFTDNAPDAVQLAIDPGSMSKADPDCFLSMRDRLAMSFASTPQGTSFDPQAAFCEGQLIEALYRVGSPAVYATLLGVLGAIPVINVALAAAMPVLGPIIATDQAAASPFIPDWAHQPGVRVVPGDFNGNGLTDIALVRQTPGWSSIPIAFANGDGAWTITNGPAPQFIADWAHQPGVQLIAGDFNGDGRTDIALVRQTPGWSTIPIVFSNGDGTWTVTNGLAPQFITDWAHQPGVQLIAGDFNGNGRTDIALVRQTPGWGSIPIAFSNGDGNWAVTNGAAPQFITEWSHQPGVQLIAGDFNGNGRTDIALVRQTPGWASIPVAFANGDGNWTITNGPAPQFITDWAHRPGARLVAGDFIRR